LFVHISSALALFGNRTHVSLVLYAEIAVSHSYM